MAGLAASLSLNALYGGFEDPVVTGGTFSYCPAAADSRQMSPEQHEAKACVPGPVAALPNVLGLFPKIPAPVVALKALAPPAGCPNALDVVLFAGVPKAPVLVPPKVLVPPPLNVPNAPVVAGLGPNSPVVALLFAVPPPNAPCNIVSRSKRVQA
jgi:hypothetical protein